MAIKPTALLDHSSLGDRTRSLCKERHAELQHKLSIDSAGGGEVGRDASGVLIAFLTAFAAVLLG